MKLRMVPKDVFTVMSLNGEFKYRWLGDNVLSLIGLGTSYLLEFFEYYGDTISKYYHQFVKDTEFADDRFDFFISQERRHAAAHKKLNLFIAKNYLPPYREKYHPRVYDFMYPTYKKCVEPIIEGIVKDQKKGLTLHSPSFKKALKSIAIFETEVCMAAFSFFDNVMEKGKLDVMMNISDNLGVLYLLGYHYVEEIEHCHVSIETYERMYGETLWTKEEINNYISNSSGFNNIIIDSTLFVARQLNVDLSIDNLNRRLPKKVNFVAPGFDAKTSNIGAKIKHLIAQWDNEWEPRILKKIRETISINNKISQ